MSHFDLIKWIYNIFFVSEPRVKIVKMSRRGGLPDQQIDSTLEEDSGGEDDTGELTGEQCQEGGSDSDDDVEEISGSET